MRRIVLAVVLTLGLVFAPLAIKAQQPKKIPRIGLLVAGSSSSYSTRVEAFQRGLRELGYMEGQNVVIDYRYAEGKTDRFPDLAAELVRLKPDVLVTSGSPGIRALMKATSAIPIVMAAIGDAVGAGFVHSLSRPGGNLTGLSFLDTEISTKRLELLKEALPHVSRVAVLRHPDNPKASLEASLAASQPLKIRIQVLDVQGPDDFDGALVAAKKGGAEAIDVLASPILFAHRKTLVELAAKHRLPGMYENKEFVESGGLLSYGASLDDMFRRAAAYVDRILKGAKPADLPVEQPTKFELVINLKTAKTLGLTIPQSVLLRADQIIQ